MIDDSEIADNLIPGGLKKSKSYHSHLGSLTYREIKKRRTLPIRKRRNCNR